MATGSERACFEGTAHVCKNQIVVQPSSTTDLEAQSCPPENVSFKYLQSSSLLVFLTDSIKYNIDMLLMNYFYLHTLDLIKFYSIK